mmetsp:Transcript_20668/g.50738  ORF Transcript_20668/g.50738 Transcript_20668/m.50738 type:complete len:589 (-) Transcript_20668:166-1932(-)|eukprot:CAMPEP_0114532016 /NCGR_PEP_ID=MMETSP0109-20121206/26420_1 /TAXON_ID=29199 /ORGANISM="Chlorarachnion reptans, Strain CCCM449" /LENGTH=588 /DNA_ID=CAMNT_0001715011 /DNA_START=1625 /DNA_END=3394 /DNA_ORIENTATION=-
MGGWLTRLVGRDLGPQTLRLWVLTISWCLQIAIATSNPAPTPAPSRRPLPPKEDDDDADYTEEHPEVVVAPIFGFLIIVLLSLFILWVLLRRRRRNDELRMLRQLLQVQNRNVESKAKGIAMQTSLNLPSTTKSIGIGLKDGGEENQLTLNIGMGVSEEYPKIKITEFRKGELLGKGAYGEVHLGLDLGTGMLMAVKSVPLTNVQKASVESFLKEVNFLKGLMHPNVVQYLGAKKDDRLLYIFLEYVSGGSLASILRQFGPLTNDLAGIFTRQILHGLNYLHNKGIAHRDIKGGNILITRDGLVKISDFGVSQRLNKTPGVGGLRKNFADWVTGADQNHRAKTGLHGTPPYMAPEVVRQIGGGIPADIWSLGCTVIEMLTGKAPWLQYSRSVPATFLAIAETKGPPPEVEKLTGNSQTFVQRCTILVPEQRATCQDLLNDPFVSGKLARERAGDNKTGSLKSNKPNKLSEPKLVRLTSISSNMNASGLLHGPELKIKVEKAKKRQPNPINSEPNLRKAMMKRVGKKKVIDGERVCAAATIEMGATLNSGSGKFKNSSLIPDVRGGGNNTNKTFQNIGVLKTQTSEVSW